MRFRPIVLAVIAALAKPGRAAFTKLDGYGYCRDDQNRRYDRVIRNIDSDDPNAALEWCLSASQYVNGLVGFSIDSGSDKWYCWYNNGSINSISTGDFNPAANGGKNSGYSGTGSVDRVDGSSGVTCYSHVVS